MSGFFTRNLQEKLIFMVDGMAKKGETPKDNFFKVENGWFEALCMASLSGNEFRAILSIIRLTYGWKKRERKLSLRQISEICKIEVRNLHRALKSLKNKNMVIVSSDDRKPATYRFNKYFLTWNIEKRYKNRLHAIVSFDDRSIVSFDDSVSSVLTIATKSDLSLVKDNIKDKKDICCNSKVATYDCNHPAYQISQFLLDQILARHENYKRPDLQNWSLHADRMLRLDKRDFEQAKCVIAWAHNDVFWKNVILSTRRLRKQYDELYLKMNGACEMPSNKTTQLQFRNAVESERFLNGR